MTHHKNLKPFFLAAIPAFIFLGSLFLVPAAAFSAENNNQSETAGSREDSTAVCDDSHNSKLAGRMLDLTNKSRRENSKKELTWSPELCLTAKIKALDQVINGYFAHTHSTQEEPVTILSLVGYKYALVGENLALNYFSADSAHEALMNSPSHRDNILSDDYSQVGISFATGKINQEAAFVIVQHFGKLLDRAPF